MHSPAMASTGRAPASLMTYGSFSGPRYYRPWSAPGGSVVHDAGRARREKSSARSTGPERLGDRATVLPAAARTALSEHLVRPRHQHQRDLDQGAGWSELPPAPTTKLPTAGRERP